MLEAGQALPVERGLAPPGNLPHRRSRFTHVDRHQDPFVAVTGGPPAGAAVPLLTRAEGLHGGDGRDEQVVRVDPSSVQAPLLDRRALPAQPPAEPVGGQEGERAALR